MDPGKRDVVNENKNEKEKKYWNLLGLAYHNFSPSILAIKSKLSLGMNELSKYKYLDESHVQFCLIMATINIFILSSLFALFMISV